MISAIVMELRSANDAIRETLLCLLAKNSFGGVQKFRRAREQILPTHRPSIYLYPSDASQLQHISLSFSFSVGRVEGLMSSTKKQRKMPPPPSRHTANVRAIKEEAMDAELPGPTQRCDVRADVLPRHCLGLPLLTANIFLRC